MGAAMHRCRPATRADFLTTTALRTRCPVASLLCLCLSFHWLDDARCGGSRDGGSPAGGGWPVGSPRSGSGSIAGGGGGSGPDGGSSGSGVRTPSESATACTRRSGKAPAVDAAAENDTRDGMTTALLPIDSRHDAPPRFGRRAMQYPDQMRSAITRSGNLRSREAGSRVRSGMHCVVGSRGGRRSSTRHVNSTRALPLLPDPARSRPTRMLARLAAAEERRLLHWPGPLLGASATPQRGHSMSRPRFLISFIDRRSTP